MEHESFTHMCHEHPLSLISFSAQKRVYETRCYGCWRYILLGDATYGCSLECGFRWLLHKECMEMPQEIMHPIHPSHPLTLHDRNKVSGSKICAVCEGDVEGLRYGCSQEGCDGLWIHLGCTAGFLKDKQPSIEHPSHHQHQLQFSKKTRWCPFPCDACGLTEKGDSYNCTLCDYWIHESCALLPLSADFPRHHPAHSLSLAFSLPSEYIKYGFHCAICIATLPVGRWVYHCNLCRYVVHLNCATSTDEKEPLMKHPSHPQHVLRFSKKRLCPSPCDACGATEKGDSYICTLCDYWIHQSCALLPLSADFLYHRHSLSLAFSPPSKYLRFGYDCVICSTPLSLRHWVYHCPIGRYVIHVNCASSSKILATKFPIAVEEMYEETIRPFIKRQMKNFSNLDLDHDHDQDHDYDYDNHNICGKYSFSNHPHLLTFTTFSFASTSSSSSSHYHCKIDDDDDDDDDFNSIPRSEIICDGCTLAIREKKQTGDGYEYESGYMSCDECKYFLHLSCFNLPPEIPSLPIHRLKDHRLMLRSADGKLTGWIECDICNGQVNGLYYKCNICRFYIDIKCASLPNTIKHAAHQRHNYLNLVLDEDFYGANLCVNCNRYTYTRMGHFKCNICRFSVCGKCVMLPPTNKHRLENHLLSLTYDACVNRPGDFYCSSCEYQMHPRLWMYHCRDCDQSFHPKCFPATSGEYRNIKYGTEQYVISSIHDHPLRFEIITNKKTCDLCRYDRYDRPGFQCASCFFVVCISCGLKHMGDAAT